MFKACWHLKRTWISTALYMSVYITEKSFDFASHSPPKYLACYWYTHKRFYDDAYTSHQLYNIYVMCKLTIIQCDECNGVILSTVRFHAHIVDGVVKDLQLNTCTGVIISYIIWRWNSIYNVWNSIFVSIHPFKSY